eukprot:4087045-Prymnesium_polylepis.1
MRRREIAPRARYAALQRHARDAAPARLARSLTLARAHLHAASSCRLFTPPLHAANTPPLHASNGETLG